MAYHYSCKPGDGEDAGVAMEREAAVGTRLDRLLAQGPVPAEAALGLAAALTEVLEIAREDAETHGDLDLRHVVVDQEGTVRVSGWGVSRTTTRAPEARPHGHRTDLFGLGRVLFAVLGGRVEVLDGVSRDDPMAWDAAMVRAWTSLPLAGVNPAHAGAVRDIGAALLRYDREVRPAALRAFQIVSGAAGADPGGALVAWAQAAVRGISLPEVPDPTAEVPRTPAFEAPRATPGPLAKGQRFQRRRAGANEGHTTMFQRPTAARPAVEPLPEPVQRPTPTPLPAPAAVASAPAVPPVPAPPAAEAPSPGPPRAHAGPVVVAAAGQAADPSDPPRNLPPGTPIAVAKKAQAAEPEAVEPAGMSPWWLVGGLLALLAVPVCAGGVGLAYLAVQGPGADEAVEVVPPPPPEPPAGVVVPDLGDLPTLPPIEAAPPPPQAEPKPEAPPPSRKPVNLSPQMDVRVQTEVPVRVVCPDADERVASSIYFLHRRAGAPHKCTVTADSGGRTVVTLRNDATIVCSGSDPLTCAVQQ